METGRTRASGVRYPPIVTAYDRTLALIEEIERLCGVTEGVSYRTVVLAMIVDALAGRSPLLRLPQAFAKLDSELLLGQRIPQEKLNDDATGRVLDRMSAVGTGQILIAVAVRAMKLVDLATNHVHHDTTSVSVHKGYDLYREDTYDHPFMITFGFSKGHRPDFK